MKSIAIGSILALFLLSIVAPPLADAQTGAQSASGMYRFAFNDGLYKSVEFDSRTDGRGTTTGYMTLTDEAKISEQEGEPDPRDESGQPFYAKAEFDQMTVEKNRAVMSGTVVDSSHRTYIGRWVQLVVEDAGEDPRLQDKVTWSFCQPEPGGWIPTDAERKYDDGAYLTWWATDAERKDDVGIPSRSYISNEQRSCRIYSLSLYAFIEVKRWEGNIQVISG